MTSEGRRQAFVGWGLGVAFVGATLSQARVQVVDRGKILAEAEGQGHFQVSKTEPPVRGSIYSADGKTMAQSEDTYELGLNYRKVPLSPAFFVSLSEATGVPATELSQRPQKFSGRVWRTPLTLDQARRVQNVRRQWDADGVSLTRSLVREYGLAETMAGIVGVVRDGKPLNGLEMSQNELLKGHAGEYAGFVDRSGSFVVDKSAPYKARKNGDDLVLALDSGIQSAALQAVKAGVQRNKAKSGCAVVIDPKTGDVLAMANWPTFDPSATWKPGDDFNMAYMGAYEPGSTFKILTIAKALDAGVVGPGTTLTCGGQIVVGPHTMHCSHGAHGTIDPLKAIAESCNVAAAKWAMDVGYQPMEGFMDSMGLFEKTDLGLPAQRAGLFNRKEVAKRVQLATIGFGQSMGCTPVNLAAAFATVANHGVMMRPRLIKKVGGVERPVQERGRILKEETAHRVMKMMEAVIQSDHGTGKELKVPGYILAGKTGTAQKIGTVKDGHVSNFVGVVPADKPRAVVLVMIDAPSAGEYYGGVVAGPVFVDIAKSVIRRFGIPPTEAGQR